MPSSCGNWSSNQITSFVRIARRMVSNMVVVGDHFADVDAVVNTDARWASWNMCVTTIGSPKNTTVDRDLNL